MTSLLVDGRRVAPLEIADGFWSRLKGLIGRSSIEGALLITSRVPVRSVHTFGMKIPIDVAFCTGDFRVLEVVTMRPNRGPIGSQDAAVTQVLEAEAGSFARWGIVPQRSQLAIDTATEVAS